MAYVYDYQISLLDHSGEELPVCGWLLGQVKSRVAGTFNYFTAWLKRLNFSIFQIIHVQVEPLFKDLLLSAGLRIIRILMTLPDLKRWCGAVVRQATYECRRPFLMQGQKLDSWFFRIVTHYHDFELCRGDLQVYLRQLNLQCFFQFQSKLLNRLQIYLISVVHI